MAQVESASNGWRPIIVKLDMDLIRNIEVDKGKRTIVKHTLRMLEELSVLPLCEGVETVEELKVLQDLGVRLAQGYVLARSSFEALTTPVALETLLAKAA